MQIDRPSEEIKPCECGYKPKFYSIGYGSNPYYIACLGCRKSLHNGQGNIKTFIKLWNDKYRHIKAPGRMINHEYIKNSS